MSESPLHREMCKRVCAYLQRDYESAGIRRNHNIHTVIDGGPGQTFKRRPARGQYRYLKDECGHIHRIPNDVFEKVEVATEWTNIGGLAPDVVAYGADRTPILIVECVVTNPPDKNKRKVLARLEKRGVKVIILPPITKLNDIQHVFSPGPAVAFAASGYHDDGWLTAHGADGNNPGGYQIEADAFLLSLLGRLQDASPPMREYFFDSLSDIKQMVDTERKARGR